jgi:hypothetical protein
MSRTSGSYLWQVKKLLRRWKLPKIIETSPAGEEENQEMGGFSCRSPSSPSSSPAWAFLGLSAFIAEQRMKEIGIRKALGATVGGISILLAKQFTKWVIVANVIAWPLAYFYLHAWLQRFAYRAAISPWTFVLTSLLVFAFALLTVSYQTIKAATADPVKSLKYE